MARFRRISSTSCGRATSSSCAGRSAATSSGSRRLGGPLLLLAGGSGIVPFRAMLRHRGRVGARAAAADVLLAVAERGDLPRGADALCADDDSTSGSCSLASGRMTGGPPGPNRQRAARRGRMAARGTAADLDLRTDGVCGVCRRHARRRGHTARSDPDRALRADRDMTSGTVMEALDGNAIAGQLFEYFGREMTTAHGTPAVTAARSRIDRRAPSLSARARHRRSLPRCGAVVIVLVTIGEMTNVHLDAFELRGGPAAGDDRRSAAYAGFQHP